MGKRAYCVRGMSNRSMAVNYAQVVERLPGEDPAVLNDPAYRRSRILTDNPKQ
ncbi:hypothetical protein KCP75_09440 [Salmonella enterica subsp. enterica]|nr:hypothetical protein KCP75_09440 [Salmonella enterica subsp. enterica]